MLFGIITNSQRLNFCEPWLTTKKESTVDDWTKCLAPGDLLFAQAVLYVSYLATLCGIVCYELWDWTRRMRLKP